MAMRVTVVADLRAGAGTGGGVVIILGGAWM
jgi:hypothetical protein